MEDAIEKRFIDSPRAAQLFGALIAEEEKAKAILAIINDVCREGSRIIKERSNSEIALKRRKEIKEAKGERS